MYCQFFAENPYVRAAHYFKIKGNKLVDARDSRIKTYINSYPIDKVAKMTPQFGPVLSLNSVGDYVNMRGFKQECVTNPDLCVSGLSIGLWLNMVKGGSILSGGSYSGKLFSTSIYFIHNFMVNIDPLSKSLAGINELLPETLPSGHLKISLAVKDGVVQTERLKE